MGEPGNCENVDVSELEQSGVELAETLTDYVMNVDLTNNQFNLVKLYEDA